MSIDWSTFGLELFNFLILVWILQRLLYRPILQAVERRRQAEAAAQESARRLRAEAEELQKTYAARLAEWAAEKARLQQQFDAEMDHRRAEAEARLEQDLARQKADRSDQEAQEKRRELEAMEGAAVRMSGQFAARLLQRLAGPEVQDKLIAMLLEDLGRLPPPQRDRLRQAPWHTVELASAYPLSDGQQAALGSALAGFCDAPPVLHCVVKAELLAGARIQAGAVTLGANIADELEAFCDAGEGSR